MSQDWEFVLNGEEDVKLTCGGAVSRKEAILLLLVFFQKHGLPLCALGDLAKLINILFGYEAVPGSLHKLTKIWMRFSSYSTLHFFCASCSVLLKSVNANARYVKRVWCANCEIWCSTMIGKGSNYFITMSIKAQLQRILERFGRFINFAGSDDGNMKDIRDGKMTRNLSQATGTNRFLTLLFSTDGSPAFNSGTKSLWPITAFVNELSPKIRFGLPIIAGLWCSDSPVFMTLFFGAFVAEMQRLRSEGIHWRYGGRTMMSKVYAVCSVPDTLARASMQNLIRFNGHFGWSWCYHQGKYDAHQVRYPILDTYQKRTDASTRLDTSKSLADGRHVRGVKGPSCLFNLPEFNLIEGYVPDYMHCVCLGVTKMLLDMWTSTKNHAEQFYIGRRDQLANINSRLLSIRPPREVSRLPRTVKVKSDWKASEWRSWLLFYGVPCLTEVLQTRYLSHLALLSSAICLLIQDSITPHQLQVADGMLFEFVVNFQLLYGVSCMTFNPRPFSVFRHLRQWRGGGMVRPPWRSAPDGRRASRKKTVDASRWNLAIAHIVFSPRSTFDLVRSGQRSILREKWHFLLYTLIAA